MSPCHLLCPPITAPIGVTAEKHVSALCFRLTADSLSSLTDEDTVGAHGFTQQS